MGQHGRRRISRPVPQTARPPSRGAGRFVVPFIGTCPARSGDRRRPASPPDLFVTPPTAPRQSGASGSHAGCHQASGLLRCCGLSLYAFATAQGGCGVRRVPDDPAALVSREGPIRVSMGHWKAGAFPALLRPPRGIGSTEPWQSR
jgi:hypothetical protein